MASMISYSKAAMKRAMAKKISWWQAAEIIGVSDRQMRRWRERYEEFGYAGQVDRQRGRHLRGQPVTASTDRAVQ
jgi:transposase